MFAETQVNIFLTHGQVTFGLGSPPCNPIPLPGSLVFLPRKSQLDTVEPVEKGVLSEGGID